jgi:hypothetical protein
VFENTLGLSSLSDHSYLITTFLLDLFTLKLTKCSFLIPAELYDGLKLELEICGVLVSILHGILPIFTEFLESNVFDS